MSDKTGIEWCDATWNPVIGCSRVSAGCQNCYAERQAIRLINHPLWSKVVKRTSHGPAWTGTAILHMNKLDQPEKWREPRRIFVNSMSDLFHESLSEECIADVFNVMATTPRHTYLVLTKRPKRMLDIMGGPKHHHLWNARLWHRKVLPNVWLGVSVEDQETADERIPLLLRTPAAVRFVSYEPALGPVDFTAIKYTHSPGYFGDALQWHHQPHGASGYPSIDWVIVGGESGPKARPCDIAWIRSAVEQCKAAGVACFVKQCGSRPILDCPSGEEGEPQMRPDGSARYWTIPMKDRKGGDMAEWPEDLRVRQFPGEQQ